MIQALYVYILCSLVHIICCQNDYVISKIGKFCEINHFKKVVWGNNHETFQNSQSLWKILMKQHSLQLKPLSNGGEDIKDEDLIVFYYNSKNCNNTINFKSVCQNVSNRPIKKSIIIVENSQWNTFLQDIASLNLGLNIYVLINEIDKNVQWKEIITLKGQNHLTINNLIYNIKGTVLEKTNDLQGLHITGIAKHWYPFFNVHSTKCKNNEHDDNCIFDGFLVELLDAASKQLNFTWSAELADDWGLQPKVGK